MSGAATVRRPTEERALASVARSARPAPVFPNLYEGLEQAHAFNDRHGVLLMQCAIARHIGGGCEE